MPRPISYAVFCLKKKKNIKKNLELDRTIQYKNQINTYISVSIFLLFCYDAHIFFFFFFFNDTATTEIYTLSLHDALPILVLMLPLLVWLTPDLRIKKSLLKCNWTIRKRLPRCKMRL